MIGSPVDAVHAERRVSLVPTTHPSTQDIRTVEWPNIENTQSSNRISAMNLFINDRQQDKAKAEVDAETFFKFNLSNRVLLQREDALKHIFSFLDLEEICMIASTCRTFSVCIAKIHFFNAEQVRQGIEFYGNLARQLNKQILTLTKGCHSLTGNNDILSQNLRFTFPIDLWMAEINSASSVRLSCHSVVFLSACREDLVVALAEFNIDARCFESEDALSDVTEVTPYDKRMIAKIILPGGSVEAESILEEAKHILKGVCSGLFGNRGFLPEWGIHRKSGLGYIMVQCANLESKDWRDDRYKRGSRAVLYLSIDPIIGIREGDSFYIPSVKAEEEQLILRCRARWNKRATQKCDFEDMVVEAIIVNAYAHSMVQLQAFPFVDISPYKQALLKAQSTYGVSYMRAMFKRHLQRSPDQWAFLSELATFSDPPLSGWEISFV